MHHAPGQSNRVRISGQDAGGGRLPNIGSVACTVNISNFIKKERMDHLDKLEAQSVYILREAYREFKSLCMLWSIGKDSTVMLWLA